MTDREAFKAGFLFRCADEGLTTEQTLARVKAAVALARAKRASTTGRLVGGALGGAGGAAVGGPSGALVGGAVGAAPDYAYNLLSWLPIAGLGVAAGGGYLGGRVLAEAGKDPAVVTEAATDELLSEYARLTDRARRVKQLRALGAGIGGGH